jgi:hypothetical protein
MKQPEIDQLFDHLDNWRLLPAYQLERRADIFFAIYLPQILKEKLGNRAILKIIPEFPVRVGTIYPEIPINKSFKIDYMVISDKKVLLVELKTENNSRRVKQDEYLEKASEANIRNLIKGLIQIFEATTSKVKYGRLMRGFEELGWVKKVNNGWKNTSQNKEIEIVYIQPEKDRNNDEKSVISFDEVADIIEKNKSPVSTRFAESLRKWKRSSNNE